MECIQIIYAADLYMDIREDSFMSNKRSAFEEQNFARLGLKLSMPSTLRRLLLLHETLFRRDEAVQQ